MDQGNLAFLEDQLVLALPSYQLHQLLRQGLVNQDLQDYLLHQGAQEDLLDLEVLFLLPFLVDLQGQASLDFHDLLSLLMAQGLLSFLAIPLSLGGLCVQVHP